MRRSRLIWIKQFILLYDANGNLEINVDVLLQGGEVPAASNDYKWLLSHPKSSTPGVGWNTGITTLSDPNNPHTMELAYKPVYLSSIPGYTTKTAGIVPEVILAYCLP